MQKALFAAALAAPALGNDPAGSWLSYAVFNAQGNQKITALNTTWTVPTNPATPYGSNAPGWWFGVQDASGNGALVQPIMAYGNDGNQFSIFNGVYDWTDGSWHESDNVVVKPGAKILSSVTYNKADNSYTMFIECQETGKSVTSTYKIERGQTEVESVGYFVLEHQPSTCKAYPSDGAMTFENIVVEVEGQLVKNAQWTAKQEKPACSSKAIVKDSSTIEFTWDPQSSDIPANNFVGPTKWGPKPSVVV